MTSMLNQSLHVLPGVLHDQTEPNTLGGISSPSPVVRLRLPAGALVAVAAMTLAVLAILLGGQA
ncbi:MAG: hypothetical protein ACXWNG_01870 [Candidatus Limnocylindrales bacterium]